MAENSEQDSFAARLTLALNVLNFSRGQLAAAVGVDKSLVSRWLSGHVKPSSYNIARISEALGTRKPGLNATLWTVPKPAFDAFLGIPPSAVVQQPFLGWKKRAWIAVAAAAGLVLIAAVWLVIAPKIEQRAGDSAQHTAAPSAPSVAVMPFLNMSGDPAKEYLSDGISEEILNSLSNIPRLRVAARTSSFSFKGRRARINEIARTLHVGAVLEGSVQQQGDRIRIVAQLIDAADGFHLWSKSYDRRLTDVFAVQDEIAQVITKELTGHLVKDVSFRISRAAKTKVNTAAHMAYLQGLFFMNKRNKDDMERGIDFLQSAVRLDPSYVDAHASLARSYAVLYSHGQRRDTLRLADKEATIALRLDPNDLKALIAKGLNDINSWNWSDAEVIFRHAATRYPTDAEAQFYYGNFLSNIDLQELAVAAGKRAVALDPLSPVMRDNLGTYLHLLNRNREAASEFKIALTLDPNFVLSLEDLCQVDVDLNEIAEARKLLNERLTAVDGKDGPLTDTCRAFIAARTQDVHELKRLMTVAPTLYARGDMTASNMGWIYAIGGDLDRAISWFITACENRDGTLVPGIGDPDLPSKLRADARWIQLMHRPLLRDWRVAHDRLKVQLSRH